MKFTRASRFALALLLVSGLLLASLSQAQNPGNETFEQIRSRGYILLGFQENAVPFVSTGDTTLEATVDTAAVRRGLTANFRNYRDECDAPRQLLDNQAAALVLNQVDMRQLRRSTRTTTRESLTLLPENYGYEPYALAFRPKIRLSND